ncbi:BTAD domain-containing putative transcriptional regulator [Streptantibioticus rubrisoli]|uniref:Winged helix-turn-helix domain-containing protein n=1 Tax=Streptantibioticus rubrisoli TaxID=1387313 RepID=A0ABT1PIV2_9ACTN|nr:BTAD domain-containing putative transcriptional regulator [Streptantibioticus rubrisoli]MCQ4045293.1 winged helix-turn-helix domain-containing protein [Streptantibioticus rubrisoli]
MEVLRAWAREFLTLLHADQERQLLPAAPAHTAAFGPTGWRHPSQQEPKVSIWCFGGFRMAVGERLIDWTKVRPRARAAMRLLAVRAGQPVHRETLIEALWPDAPADSATANLQVAISSLRNLLEPDRERRKPRLVIRDGDAYLLNLPAGAHLDTLAFQAALAYGRRARAAGNTAMTRQGLRDALAVYRGELLPEDGPAEWLQQDREMYRYQAANAAADLAALELEVGNPQEAVTAAENCLAIDPCRDQGWHLLINAYQRIGAPAAAERARRRYTAMLASLGISTDRPVVTSLNAPYPVTGRRVGEGRRHVGRVAR